MINKAKGQIIYSAGREALVQLRYFLALYRAEAEIQGWPIDSVEDMMYDVHILALLGMVRANTSEFSIAPIKNEEPDDSGSSGGDATLPF